MRGCRCGGGIRTEGGRAKTLVRRTALLLTRRPDGRRGVRPWVGIVPDVRTPGPLVLDALVWVLFAVLFVGAALLVKVAAALLGVLVVLAVLLGLTLRVLRKRRPRPVQRRHPDR